MPQRSEALTRWRTARAILASGCVLLGITWLALIWAGGATRSLFEGVTLLLLLLLAGWVVLDLIVGALTRRARDRDAAAAPPNGG